MSTRFDSIIGHEPIIRLLKDAVTHPGQGYLFHGPAGVGKRTIARAFASEILKLDPEKQLEAHPDFVTLKLEEGKKNISVEAARNLATRMSMSAAAGGFVVALIEGAERLSESATNALLKSVEEPAKNVVYIFLAEEASRLPVTLRSRLAPIAFHAVRDEVITSWLEQKDVADALAEEAVRMSSGSPGIALRFSEHPEEWRRRIQEMRELLDVMMHGNMGEALSQIEVLTKTCDSSEDVSAAWRESLHILMSQWAQLEEKNLAYAKLGEGLARAWNMVGSSLSPRMALEWTLAEPYLVDKQFIPSFFKPRYL